MDEDEEEEDMKVVPYRLLVVYRLLVLIGRDWFWVAQRFKRCDQRFFFVRALAPEVLIQEVLPIKRIALRRTEPRVANNPA
jgi:hypothetical protein